MFVYKHDPYILPYYDIGNPRLYVSRTLSRLPDLTKLRTAVLSLFEVEVPVPFPTAQPYHFVITALW